MITFRCSQGVATRRGSLLVPIVAAMAILSLSGMVLSQAFSAQRVQSVLAVESSRAFWIAEAGAWHAAMAGTSLTSAVGFDQGSYITETASGSTTEPLSRGTFGRASRRVPLAGPLYQNSNAGGGQAITVPIDKSASESSVTQTARTRFALDLHSARSYPSVLSSIEFQSSDNGQTVAWVEYDDARLWTQSGPTTNGTVQLDLSAVDPTLRIVEPSPAAVLEIRVSPSPNGTDNYTLVLHFTDGTSTTLQFPIDW